MKALEINQLHKIYSNGVKALNGINFSVEAGDFFALLGPNGAGKSTTIGIISSLVNKTSGQVKVCGLDLDQEIGAVKKLIGLVPQEFNFNIFEPVEQIVVQQAGYYGVAPKIAKERAAYYLNALGLWEKRNTSARALSGGMKRRLMIVRALLHEPSVLILDEPTAGVDIELRRSLWEFLQDLNARGRTIILTTHYLEEAESLCRNIAIIDKGQVIENTDKKTLLNKLHLETFILYLREPLNHCPEILGFEAQLVDENTLAITVQQGQDLNPIFALLDAQGIRIQSMKNKANRLEELFIKLTNPSVS